MAKLSDTQISFFKQEGYLILDRPVIGDGRRVALLERLNAVVAGKSAGQPESVHNMVGGSLEADRVVVQVVNIWQAEPLFHELIYDPDITEMVSELIGDSTIRLWHDQVQLKPSLTGAPTDWHQDHPYWPIIQPADLVSCWVALDDATLENGCMRVVPGSHKWGPAPEGLKSDENFNPVYNSGAVPEGTAVTVAPCEVPAGHCMFHHCLTWHGSFYNHSSRPRPAIAMHYMPGYTRYEPKSEHMVEHRVTVQPGEILRGEFFPTVRENGVPLRAPG